MLPLALKCTLEGFGCIVLSVGAIVTVEWAERRFNLPIGIWIATAVSYFAVGAMVCFASYMLGKIICKGKP